MKNKLLFFLSLAFALANLMVFSTTYGKNIYYEFFSYWYLASAGFFIFLFYFFYQKKIPAAAWVLAVFVLALAFFSAPATARDFLHYLFDGEMVVRYHLSPYEVLPVSLPPDHFSSIFFGVWWAKLYSPYGPFWQLILSAINIISFNGLFWGIVWLKIVNLMALIFGAWQIFKISNEKSLAYLYLLNPLMIYNSLANPHPDMIIAALLLAAWRFKDRPLKSASCAVWAGLIKAHALAAVPFLIGKKDILNKIGYYIFSGAASLLVLKLILGFKFLPMFLAAVAGTGGGEGNLLVYAFLPGLSPSSAMFLSLLIYLSFYLMIYGCFIKNKIAGEGALALSLLLVPLLLMAMVYPWHFIIPLSFFYLWRNKASRLVIAYVSFISFIAPLNLAVAIIYFFTLFFALGIFKNALENIFKLSNRRIKAI